MCFDISYALSRDRIEERFDAEFGKPDLYEPVYHVSAFSIPFVPVITNHDVHTIQMMHWGLVPHWVKDEDKAMDIRTKTLNARSESIFDKPSFRHAARNKRCLVIADGFFEWREIKGKNFPYYIRMADHGPFALAGIWDTWYNGDIDEDYDAFSIVTTRANPLLAKIHNKKKRMPAILLKEQETNWLNTDISKEDIGSVLAPIDDRLLEAHTVSRLVSFRRKRETNVPQVIEKYEYDELKFEQTSLF
jgi:putative SOS response-associated peptidase YedK